MKSGVTEVRKIHTENNGKSRLPIEKPGLHYEKAGLQLGLPILKSRLHLGSKLGSETSSEPILKEKSLEPVTIAFLSSYDVA